MNALCWVLYTQRTHTDTHTPLPVFEISPEVMSVDWTEGERILVRIFNNDFIILLTGKVSKLT